MVICEGEKAADTAAEMLPDHVAVTSPNGANSAHKADWRALAGRDVTLWPDNDGEGRAYAAAVLRALRGIAASVRVASTPAGACEKWDAADALAEGWDQARAAALIAAALPEPGDDAVAGDPASDDAEIARLAALPLVAYSRDRKPAAERLRCPVSILDRAVAAERGKGSNGTVQGRPLDLYEPEPWPDPVDGAALLDALTAAIRRHAVLGSAEADAAALWALATHAFDAFSIFPRLFATAPEKQCGKSTLLDVIGHLVPRKEAVDNITAAALFRFIEAAHPTLLLDEADSYARDNEDLRNVLDSEHRRNCGVIRTVATITNRGGSLPGPRWRSPRLGTCRARLKTAASGSRCGAAVRMSTLNSCGTLGPSLSRNWRGWPRNGLRIMPPRLALPIRRCLPASLIAQPTIGAHCWPSPILPAARGPSVRARRRPSCRLTTRTACLRGCYCSRPVRTVRQPGERRAVHAGNPEGASRGRNPAMAGMEERKADHRAPACRVAEAVQGQAEDRGPRD